MSPGAAPPASTITIGEVLALLDTDFASLARGVAEGQYALWLGSGISRERVADLDGVIVRVLSHLRERIIVADPNCRFRVALDQVIGYAQLSAAERAQVDYDQPVAEWPVLDIVLQRLALDYARLLDVRVRGEVDDYLLWNAVDISTTYAAKAAAPDCEHLCIAILAIEGVLPDVASANWDGLIEAAVDELTSGSGATLRVCVRAEDFREPLLQARLLKFHGCGVRAGLDPPTYRPLLIARLSQIAQWGFDPAFAVMRHQLVSLTTTRPTLMIGLSVQDTNIQQLFLEGHATMPWVWPSDPPAHVFAEETLRPDQLTLLRCVYGDAYTANVTAIEEGARLRAYAKPLLTALVLHVLCAKFIAFIAQVNAPSLTAVDRAQLERGVVALRNRAAIAAEVDRLVFVRDLVQGMIRGLTLFQEGAAPAPGTQHYRAASALPVHRIASDPTLATSGMRELAAALALIGLGEEDGEWFVAVGDTSQPNDGVVRITAAAGSARMFFAVNDRAGVQLEIGAIVAADDDDAVVVHSTAPAARITRSPRAARGRTGRVGLREIAMADLLLDAGNVSELRRRFREEAAL